MVRLEVAVGSWLHYDLGEKTLEELEEYYRAIEGLRKETEPKDPKEGAKK